MKKLMVFAALAAVCAGCATKTRNVEISGLFTQAEAGVLAVGSVDVMATPLGEETAMIKFAKDYNYFQDDANYDIKVQMTGTNSVEKLPDVVEKICNAFVRVAEKTVDVKKDDRDFQPPANDNKLLSANSQSTTSQAGD